MSRENVEIIGSYYEAINRLELDDALQYLHPDGEIHPALGGVMDIGRRYHGRDGLTRLLRTITEGVEGVETSIGGGETFLAEDSVCGPSSTVLGEPTGDTRRVHGRFVPGVRTFFLSAARGISPPRRA